MKKCILFLLILGFTFSAFAQITLVDSMLYKGVYHYYRVYLPAYHKCSMIIHLHGYGSSGALEQSFTNYMPVADSGHFIVVYPDGLLDSTGLRYWNVGWPWLPNTDDVGYLGVLIDTLRKNYFIDADNVFVSGFSMGGIMCHKLACELSTKIAAIASISGSMTLAQYADCTPPGPVPVMEIHGTADNTIPYTGSSSSQTPVIDIDTLIKFCADLNQCNPLPAHTLLAHNAQTTDGSTVDHYVYTGGTEGPDLKNATCELYKINGGSHIEWPGQGGSGNNDFNASAEIWRFFNNYDNGYTCLLPITLVGFTGTVEKGTCLLQWQTVSETNNKYFVVQHATDAVNFFALGKVKGHGTTSVPQQYSFTDASPAMGINYYRLKQVDNDGKFSYSNIIAVDITGRSTLYTIYPNPAKGSINIHLPASASASVITISDMLGRVVLQKQLTGNAISVQVDVSTLAAGLYQLHWQWGAQTQYWKFVKL